ncbi:MAG TPA: type III polyketide synthase [Sphingomonas sp.]|uniref:type III polyketide synthase n=1 Tax=Sphingomonas sp. TaxID=28214 RepID=UPI002CB7297D|nr:type III polyketide synthase [Sphingomonas sp.]HMI19299.1 type III polyketide synthase [Sphingomonas sp.]
MLNGEARAPRAHLHAIGTAVPDLDVHQDFIDWATTRLTDRYAQSLFRRMSARSGITHRWSVLPHAKGGSPITPGGFYFGNRLPSTAARMQLYAEKAPELALAAIAALAEKEPLGKITHLVVASCTGFVAPGIDQLIARRLGLDPGIERTLVGFMGCYAAVAALRVAYHIARSEPQARVLVVTVELSTLHLVETDEIESMLAMLQFADGAAAAIVSAEEGPIAIDRFFAATLPDSSELIQWTIGDAGFEMHLSGKVPGRIAQALHDPDMRAQILHDCAADEVAWAVHAGGRSILDSVETALALPPEALDPSRAVLNAYGNMSSATLMFVLDGILDGDDRRNGIALAFGPGLAAEGFGFSRAA